MSKLQINGTIVRDFDVRHTPRGQAVASSAICEHEKWTDKKTGEPREKSRFFNIEAWNDNAEALAKNVSKGELVSIVGSLDVEKWQDKDGKNREKVKIVIRHFDVIAKKKSSQEAPAKESPRQEKPAQRSFPPPARPIQRPLPRSALATGTEGSHPANDGHDDDIPF